MIRTQWPWFNPYLLPLLYFPHLYVFPEADFSDGSPHNCCWVNRRAQLLVDVSQAVVGLQEEEQLGRQDTLVLEEGEGVREGEDKGMREGGRKAAARRKRVKMREGKRDGGRGWGIRESKEEEGESRVGVRKEEREADWRAGYPIWVWGGKTKEGEWKGEEKNKERS